MVTPELITYIRQQLASGASKEKIAKALAPQGWLPQDISQAFSSIATPSAISSTDQTIIAPSFVGRKILLSSSLVIASGLYVFFQYSANALKTSAVVAYVPPPTQNASISTPVADMSSSPSAPTVAEQTPTASASPQPAPTPTPTPVRKRVPLPATVSSPTPAPTRAPLPAPKPKGRYMDGTYTGKSADAYYGMVQVEEIIQNGALADVKILQYPNDRNTSIEINSQALPILKQEAISAQSATIDAVSGASDTSPAFIASLSSALAQAKN